MRLGTMAWQLKNEILNTEHTVYTPKAASSEVSTPPVLNLRQNSPNTTGQTKARSKPPKTKRLTQTTI